MQEQFQVFSDILTALTDDEFDTATVRIEVDDGWSRIGFACTRGGQEIILTPEPLMLSDADDAVDEIIEQMEETGDGGWNAATFTMKPDGDFTFEVQRPD